MTSCVFFRARVRGSEWWSTSCPWPSSRLSSTSPSTSKRPSLSRLSSIKGKWRHLYFPHHFMLRKLKLLWTVNHFLARTCTHLCPLSLSFLTFSTLSHLTAHFLILLNIVNTFSTYSTLSQLTAHFFSHTRTYTHKHIHNTQTEKT